jgi:predicted Zn finger-like uncharacterized protein
MRVACSRCQTKFDVPEERLSAGAVKVRCSECGNTFVVRRRAHTPEEGAEPVAASGVPDESWAGPGADIAAPEDAAESPEAKFDDFDFDDFSGADGAVGKATHGELAVSPDEATASDEDMPPIGELDLGDFGGLEEDLESLDELDLGSLQDDLAEAEPEIEEPLPRVKEEDLVSAVPVSGVPVQGLADDMPRLDIQRGPRRSEGPARSPVVARDRRHSPLLWVVVVVALATAGFTGYLVYTKKEAAFTFLSPTKIRELWQRRNTEAKLEAVDLQAYSKDLPADRRVYIIQGNVLNRSPSPQSLIKVRGELFGPDGASVARRDVFCGNVLSENELATLPLSTIEARLNNEVGEGLRNVDIAPKSKVPFMVVFPDPPVDVTKFNVIVTEARAGSDS